VFECVLGLLATSAAPLALGEVLGCAFHNHAPRLDSTDTENTTAAMRATPAINNGTTCLVDLGNFEFLRKLKGLGV
jgi:hypothetical protein